MIFLILSILCYTLISVNFKLYDHFKIDNLQAITTNYIVCATIGFFLIPSTSVITEFTNHEAFPITLLIGLVFLGTFFLIARTTQIFGITVATIAGKLAVVIPFIFGIVLYNESIDIYKIGGIILACISVIVTSYKPDILKNLGLKYLFLPLIIFIIGGVLDTTMKYMQNNFLQESDFNPFLFCIFSTSALLGVFYISYRVISGKETWKLKNIIAGITLGIPNYGSLYFLIMALDYPGWESSTVFPINNSGIVAISALVSIIFFKEKMRWWNILGLFLAGLAILLLAKGF